MNTYFLIPFLLMCITSYAYCQDALPVKPVEDCMESSYDGSTYEFNNDSTYASNVINGLRHFKISASMDLENKEQAEDFESQIANYGFKLNFCGFDEDDAQTYDVEYIHTIKDSIETLVFSYNENRKEYILYYDLKELPQYYWLRDIDRFKHVVSTYPKKENYYSYNGYKIIEHSSQWLYYDVPGYINSNVFCLIRNSKLEYVTQVSKYSYSRSLKDDIVENTVFDVEGDIQGDKDKIMNSIKVYAYRNNKYNIKSENKDTQFYIQTTLGLYHIRTMSGALNLISAAFRTKAQDYLKQLEIDYHDVEDSLNEDHSMERISNTEFLYKTCDGKYEIKLSYKLQNGIIKENYNCIKAPL